MKLKLILRLFYKERETRIMQSLQKFITEVILTSVLILHLLQKVTELMKWKNSGMM